MHNLVTVCTFGITNWRIHFGNVSSRYEILPVEWSPKKTKHHLKDLNSNILSWTLQTTLSSEPALLSNISYEILNLRDADFRKRERNNFCFNSKERKQARKKIHSLAVMCSVVLNIKWSISYKPIKRPLRDLLTCFSDTFGDVVCTGKHFTFD